MVIISSCFYFQNKREKQVRLTLNIYLEKKKKEVFKKKLLER